MDPEIIQLLSALRKVLPSIKELWSWNANGLLNKISVLQVFADQHSPDVILVQETHIRPGTNPPNLPNYIFYRNDFILSDNRRRYSYPGGTGIFIKRHIPHQHIPTPPLATIQATIIQVNFPNPTAFISTYIPPQKKNPSNPNRLFFLSMIFSPSIIPSPLTSLLVTLTVTIGVGTVPEQTLLVFSF
ncbi:RNA-directed DNA polymerase from mobile element jockey [Caerostris extrusa]|uniref:RNA-directed DNA polymerase from mobile element jockey n=1 Tax=Caerostris extrusa TaxID=172846 RepID=A0AAV4MLQ0_CAEEX|nr:RNA-directed DNA polymerase from mobile element jockey [Caerostris extrusa]